MPIPLRARLLWPVVATLTERVPLWQLPPDKIQLARRRRQKLLAGPGAWLVAGREDPDARAEDATATLADGSALPVRIYRPRYASAGALPVVVNFHGGGFMMGDARQSEWWCSAVAARAHVVVVSVDYRLAPEHPFPAAPEDCFAATVWVGEHAAELGVDPARLAVMGDSAGGNLAAVVSVMARDRGGPPIALQVLIYPCVELIDTFPSEDENAETPILRKADLAGFSRIYRGEHDGTDPYGSPLRAKHEGLPPALIQTAQYDPLRDQGAAYAAALSESGVQVRLTNYVDAVHGYISVPGVVPAARQALAEVVDQLRGTLGGR